MMRSILFHWDHGYAWLEFSLLSRFDAFHSLRFFLALPFFNVLNCINLIFPSFFPPALKTPGFLRKCVIYFCWFGRGFQLFVRRNVSGWLETRGRAPTALPSQTWEPERWEKLLPKPVSVETAAVLAEHVHSPHWSMTSHGHRTGPPAPLFTMPSLSYTSLPSRMAGQERENWPFCLLSWKTAWPLDFPNTRDGSKTCQMVLKYSFSHCL